MRVSDGAGAVAVQDRWNHNIHYHSLVLDALPPDCERVLDVGCGEGLLALALSRRVRRVTAIDRHAPTLELAQQHASADNIDYVLGDFLAHPFEPASFDAVVSVVVLHHIGLALGLERMTELLRPGGRLAVIGMAATRSPIDLGFDLAGAIATRLHKLTKTHWETSAPKIWPIPHSYGHERRIARRLLPGVRYRRHILWRYSLVWTKPT
jgi:2-polyprenyl-3-methyl-5-hydroxy-6-metoxy-1,4-benzoquinol methylase